MPQTYRKILFFVLILSVLVSCDTTKYVPEGEYLLQKNTVLVNNKKGDKELYNYIYQQPNSSMVMIPIGLYFYNLGDPDFPKTLEDWRNQVPSRYDMFTKMFSEKQTEVIYNFYKRMNNWFINKGQPPVIYDEKKTEKTAVSFKNYFFRKGFFEVDVNYKDTVVAEKKKEVTYLIETSSQYYIDTVITEINSPVLDSIYHTHFYESGLKPRDKFVFDNFEKEQNRITKLFRNSGVFNFTSNYVSYWTDSLHTDKFKEVTLYIPDRRIVENDTVYFEPFKLYKINKVRVYTDFDMGNLKQVQKDSAVFEGITYYAPDKLKYNPKYLSDAIFIKPGFYYSDKTRNLTIDHLRKLQNFRTSIKVNYKENPEDATLDVDIYLVRTKKYDLTVNLDATTSNIKPFGILGKFSFLDKNLFRGAEILELSFQGSFLNVSNDASTSDGFFNAWETIVNTSLTIPRIFFPLNTDAVIPKYMSPQTVFDLSGGMQKNIGLDRQTLTTGLGYMWQSSERISHKLDLYNMQYIKNRNIENYFLIYNSEYKKLNDVAEDVFGTPLPKDNDAILQFMDHFLDPDNNYQDTHPEEFDTVSDVKERREILIEDILVPVISYFFTYNTKEGINDVDFWYFSWRIIAAGNVTTWLSNKTNQDGQKTLLGLPIAQYLKTEVEFKKYWQLSTDNVLVFRTFWGAAFPYGNSKSIPFSRSYNAGGSNDIRAWRTFDLGPGGERNNLEFKVGSFKMVTNLEYRFKVTESILSALFIDAGNIWDITNSNLVTDAGKLTGLKSFKNTAIGSGFGIRYNFGFLVFRFDIGFKTYEPYLEEGRKWFTNYNFGNATYNIGINYPF